MQQEIRPQILGRQDFGVRRQEFRTGDRENPLIQHGHALGGRREFGREANNGVDVLARRMLVVQGLHFGLHA
ncbi:hypothetical protein D3C87_1632670 [compost metagenome]